MKITICGSIAFYDEMVLVKNALEKLDHEAHIPPSEIKNQNGKIISVKDLYQTRQVATASDTWVWDRKEVAMMRHFEEVAWADAILVLNYDKKGTKGYIGANTLMEMGLAFYLKKPIYLLYDIPSMSYSEEILGVKPIIIKNNLKLIA